MTSEAGHLIVSGRWDNNVAVIDVSAALDPANDGTPAAVISRPRVTPDIDCNGDGRPETVASGQPVVVKLDAKAERAYVVNHSGAASPEAAGKYQHGHPGLITVLNVPAVLDPANSGNLGAVESFISTRRTGPVGCGITPDGNTLLVNCGEAAESEDGGNEVTAIDLESRDVIRHIPLREKSDHPAKAPSRHDAPHASFGRYPNPTGMAISPLRGGLVFVGNGGFSDVSVLDLTAALAGDPDPEINRVAIETGPFGLASSPDGRLVAVAARESMSDAFEGSTISIIDAGRAGEGGRDAEIARIRIGGDDPAVRTRPFAVAFTQDGNHIVASCFRSNTISIVNVADAAAGRKSEVERLYPKTPNGAEPRPRGIVMVGPRHAAIIGGAKSGPRSSLVWLLDLDRGRIAGTVTGTGNESYFLDWVPPHAKSA